MFHRSFRLSVRWSRPSAGRLLAISVSLQGQKGRKCLVQPIPLDSLGANTLTDIIDSFSLVYPSAKRATVCGASTLLL